MVNMKFAQELNKKAKIALSKKDNDIVYYVLTHAEHLAEDGLFKLSVIINKSGWTIDEAKIAISILEKKYGFSCTLLGNESEIILGVNW